MEYIQNNLKRDIGQYHIAYSCNNKYIPIHKHTFIEMMLVLSGQGKVIVNGMGYELKSGSLCIMLPWHMHEIIPDTNNLLETITCFFDLEIFTRAHANSELDDLILGNLDALSYVYFEETDFKRVSDIFKHLLREYTDQNHWKDALIYAKIVEVLVLFDRMRKSTSEIVKHITVENNHVIWDIINFIHLLYRTDITLSTIAEKFILSEKDLNILLKRHTGLNFNNLLDEIRIRNACFLLIVFDLSVPLLSNLLGYKNTRTFLKAFIKMKNMEPEEFKRSHFVNYESENIEIVPSKLYSQVIYYLHLHCKEELTLADIAREFHLDENYLASILRSQTGQDFIDLLNEIRIFHKRVRSIKKLKIEKSY